MPKQSFQAGTEAKSTRRTHGNLYEEKALQYLLSQGYRLLARNVNYRFGEIDLIMEQKADRKHLLVFVEVRKTDPRSWLSAEETLTFSKQKSLIRSVQKYLSHYSGRASEVRIDLIGFRGDDLRHFIDFVRIY